jgi:hypothetical protein
MLVSPKRLILCKLLIILCKLLVDSPGAEADIGKHVPVSAHGGENGMHPIESYLLLHVLLRGILSQSAKSVRGYPLFSWHPDYPLPNAFCRL